MDIRIEDDSSLADRVYIALENAIMTGEIKLGERLLENEIADKLQVSRAPLREAFRRLQHEGLAGTVPRRGTYVVKPSRQDVIDLLVVREALETAAARLAAELISKAELARLAEGLERIGKLVARSRKEGYPAHDLDFHQTVMQASRNGKLLQMMSGMYRQLRLVRSMSGASAIRGLGAYKEHMAIFEALTKHNPKAAEECMRTHLRASADNILKTIKDES